MADLDRISIAGLHVHGSHGVLANERAGPGFVVDAVLWLDTGRGRRRRPRLDCRLRSRRRPAGGHRGGRASHADRDAGRPAGAACLADEAVHAAEVTVHKPEAPVPQQFSRHRRHDPPEPAMTGPPASRGALPGEQPRRPAGHLQLGLSVLCGAGLSCQAVSSVFETAPVGGPEQDNYLNAVLLGRSALPARDILARCQAAEVCGRPGPEQNAGAREPSMWTLSRAAKKSAPTRSSRCRTRGHMSEPSCSCHGLRSRRTRRLPGHGQVARLPAVARQAGVRRQPQLRLWLPASAGPEATGR